LILMLLAIPFASVTAAAVMADVASTTDPSVALAGLPASAGGVVVGLGVVRLARTVVAGARLVQVALLGLVRTVAGLLDGTATVSVVRPTSVPVPVFVPASTGRRGPPSSRR
jgi:hypothetical protein